MVHANRPAPPCPFEKVFPSQLVRNDEFYVWLAYNQAIDAWRQDEVPIGAVIELGGESGVEREPHLYPGSYVEYVTRTGHEAPGVHA